MGKLLDLVPRLRRRPPPTPEVLVWVCPRCEHADNYEAFGGEHAPRPPDCDWCADDPEGGLVEMVLYRATPA